MIDKLTRNILLNSGKLDKEKAYWIDKLGSEFSFGLFPVDHPYPAQWEYKGAVKEAVIPSETCGRLAAISNQSDYALYVILLSGIQYLLSVYTGREEAASSMPVFKPGKEAAPLVNAIVALRTTVNAGNSFKELLAIVKQTVTEANANRNFPLEKLGELLDLSSDAQEHPLVHACIMLDSIHDPKLIEGLPIDLLFRFEKSGAELAIQAQYNETIYSEDTINAIVEKLLLLYSLALQQPATPLRELPLFTEEEQRQIADKLARASSNRAYAGPRSRKNDMHPLMQRCVEQSVKKWVFESDIQLSTLWVLKERKLADRNTLPSTAYVDMAVYAARVHFKQDTIGLRNVQFYTPFIALEGKKQVLRTVIEVIGERLSIQIASSAGSDASSSENWTIHAVCEAAVHGSRVPEKADIGQLQQRCGSMTSASTALLAEDRGGFGYGPRWQGMVSYGQGQNEAVISAQLPAEFADDLDAYSLHPALLEKASVYNMGSGHRVFPIGMRSVKVYAPLTGKLFSRLSWPGGSNGPLVQQGQEQTVYDLSIMDDTGAVLLEIEGHASIVIEDAHKTSQALSGNGSLYHQVKWVRSDLADLGGTGGSVSADSHKTRPAGAVLILRLEEGTGRELSDAYRAQGVDVIDVIWGERYSKESDSRFTIAGAPDDYERLLDEAGEGRITQIVHMLATVSNDVGASAEFKDAQQRGVWSLFNLVKALGQLKQRNPLELLIVAYGAMAGLSAARTVNPAYAPLIGLSKVISEEYVHISCRGIDIDERTSVASLLRELTSASSSQITVYDGELRHVKQLDELDIEELGTAEHFPIVPGGVYLITGGTGGLGLEIAKYLTTLNKVKLILVNRSIMPERAIWDELIESSGINRKLVKQIAAIREMEQSGSTVVCYDGNITDEKRMNEIVSDVKRLFGGINGVIHAAGAAGDGFIARKEASAFREVLSPKVDGTVVLDLATAQESLDFFVLFSSIATLAGAAGQGDYTAANSFLDSYAAYRRGKGKRTLAINWAGWSETGMAVDYGTQESFFSGLGTRTAVQAFAKALDSGLTNVVIGQLNLTHQVWEMVDRLPIRISDELRQHIATIRAITVQRKAAEQADSSARSGSENSGKAAGLTAVTSNAVTETERRIAAIWGEILGFDTINIEDTFSELGGHSLNAITLVKLIHSEMNVDISLGDVFLYPTIQELARQLDSSNTIEHVSIPQAPLSDVYPLTSAQKRLFILQHMEGVGTSYNMPDVRLIEGKLNKERLRQAFQSLADRHESLRTTFEWHNDEPVQRIHKEVEIPLSVYQLADGEDAEKHINAFVRPFALDQAPLFRVGIVELAEDRSLLLFDLHHIVADGLSMDIITSEFVAFCEGNSLPELRIQYKDFAVWQNEQLNTGQLDAQKRYWKEQISGELPVLQLPTDYPRPAAQSFEGGIVTKELSPGEWERLQLFAESNGVTIYMLLLAAYTLVLSKYSGQEDVIIGSPVGGRSHVDLNPIIGIMVNTLPMRNYPTGDKTFLAFLDEVKNNALQAFENQDVPFEWLVEQLSIRRDPSRNPIFDTMLVMRNMEVNSFVLDGVHIRPYTTPQVMVKFDLLLELLETDGQHKLFLEYATKLFTEETAVRLMDHLLHILDSVMANPQQQLSAIEMILPEERHKLITVFNDTATPYPSDKTVHQWIAEQAAASPDAAAVIGNERSLTYRELDEQAERLAHSLAAAGAERESIIGIMMKRSPDLLVGLLGIWKTGAAYIPIDPEYPADRIRHMLEDSGAKLLLTDGADAESLTYSGGIVSFDELLASAGSSLNDPATRLEPKSEPNDLAYMIYTSGSTGKPKGVLIEHRSVANFIAGITSAIDFSPAKKVLLLTTVSFDIFVLEALLPLAVGAAVVIADEQQQKEPKEIAELIIRNGIDMLQMTPSRMQMLLHAGETACLQGVKEIMLGGEPLPAHMLDSLKGVTPSRIYNMYGPTETTIWSALQEVTHAEHITIGRPIANTQLFVVDQYGGLQPIGAVGELCIAGDGLARGYWNRPELTEEKFVPCPFLPGRFMYRTGDLARWLSDGTLECLGRADSQVKIRGHRIELGEIEAEMLQADYVLEAAVATVEEDEGAKSLCAYYVSKDGQELGGLREHLALTLPGYMVPAYLIRLDRMPLTPNGKLDRKALPKPDSGLLVQHSDRYEAPSSKFENVVASVWQQVLRIERVGANDNFFELGGHSLNAVVMIKQLHRAADIELSLGDVFAHATVKGLAKRMEKAEVVRHVAIEPAPEREVYPLSPGQRRIFILQHIEGVETSYNMPGTWLIEGKLDIDRLEGAFKAIVERHEALRTTFEWEEGEPVQRIHKQADVRLFYHKLASNESAEGIIASFIQPFALDKAPLCRFGIIELSEQRFLLLFDVHHIAADGLSMDIVTEEFAALYEGRSLPEQRLQYKDYAVWQNAQLETGLLDAQKQYWQQTLSGELPVLAIPTDYPRPSAQSFEGGTVTRNLDAAQWEQLKRLAERSGATPYMVVLAAYSIVLSKHAGQEDVIIGSPVGGRNHADLDRMIGMMVNTLAMRNYPSGQKKFLAFLEEVKNNALQAFDNAAVPFEWLVDQLSIRRDPSRNPIFDTMLIMRNVEVNTLSVGGIHIRPMDTPHVMVKFDLLLEVVETDGQPKFYLDYAAKLFTEETAIRLMDHLHRVLDAVIADPNGQLSAIQMIAPEERSKLEIQFNETTMTYAKDITVHEWIAEQARTTPAAAAVIGDQQTLSYAELDEQSSRLAVSLAAAGVGRGSIVGIMMKRSPDLITGLLGIWKAGAAYVPIDPEYPVDRIRHMLEDSGAKLLLSKGVETNSLYFDGAIMSFDDLLAAAKGDRHSEGETQLSAAGPEDLAYVIYTSGSTGKPKGVMIEHRSVVNFMTGMTSAIDFSAEKKVLLLTTVSFDIFVLEALLPLAVGAAVVIADEQTQKDPKRIAEAISRYDIDMLQMTPSRMQMLLHAGQTDCLRYVKEILLGGEPLPPLMLDSLKQLTNARLYNMYGPTETTIWSTMQEVTNCDYITIGRPIANTQVFIVDQYDGLLPHGAAGELCIAGDGLARGYWNRPDLTAEKFVPCPFLPGRMMYRTGDLAKWLPDGTLVCLGRIDTQVKVRGHRIELGEIETALLQQEGVFEAAVTTIEDETGIASLCAYFTADNGVEASALKEQLSRSLPSYMVPSFIIQVEKMPLTPNGKLDRKSLPKPEERQLQGGEGNDAPFTALEKTIAAVWMQVLKVDKVGVNDDFFDLGGHSLLAIRLEVELESSGLPAGGVNIYEHNTIKAMAAVIQPHLGVTTG